MDIKDRNTQIIIGAAVLVIAIAIIWWAVASRGAQGASSTATTTAATSSQQASAPSTTVAEAKAPTTVETGDSVTVEDQSASSSVQVASVTLTQRGWVAVRDDRGITLGAALFRAGTHTNVIVPLLRATSPNQQYQVLLYVDNGNKQFDLHGDTLVINPDGTVAGTTFKTNGTPVSAPAATTTAATSSAQ